MCDQCIDLCGEVLREDEKVRAHSQPQPQPRETEARRPELRCTFCSRGQDEIRKLVAGAGVCICDRCVALGQEAIRASSEPILYPAWCR